MRFGRAALRRWYTRTCSPQLAQPDDHPPAGGLLHHLLTLTRHDGGRLFSSALTHCRQQLPVKKWDALRCPDFPPAPIRSQRQARDLLPRCKVRLFFWYNEHWLPVFWICPCATPSDDLLENISFILSQLFFPSFSSLYF